MSKALHLQALDKLNCLLPGQFDTVVFRFEMPTEYQHPGTQAQQAINLINYAIQQNSLEKLLTVIADFIPEQAPTAVLQNSHNPFGDIGRITDPALYFTRQAIQHEIFESLRKGMNISLLGPSQSGKSSLLEAVWHLGPQQLQREASRFVYLNLQGINNDEDFFSALCCETGLPQELSGYKLTRALQQQATQQPFVLCLDEIECLCATQFSRMARDHLRSLADGSNAPLTLLIASRSSLGSLFPDNPKESSPLAGVCHTLELPPFSEMEIRAFLKSRLVDSGVAFSAGEMTAIWQQSGGNPRQMQKLAAELYQRRVADA